MIFFFAQNCSQMNQEHFCLDSKTKRATSLTADLQNSFSNAYKSLDMFVTITTERERAVENNWAMQRWWLHTSCNLAAREETASGRREALILLIIASFSSPDGDYCPLGGWDWNTGTRMWALEYKIKIRVRKSWTSSDKVRGDTLKAEARQKKHEILSWASCLPDRRRLHLSACFSPLSRVSPLCKAAVHV